MSAFAHPVIVIEGPDCGGKTTLARALCDATGVPYRHEGPPPEGAPLLRHYLAPVFDAATTGIGGVFDRLALGELVYGPILRGASRLSPEEFAVFEGVRGILGVRHIVCLPSLDTCRAAWAERAAAGRELFRDPGTFARTWVGFMELARAWNLEIYDRDFEPLGAAVGRFTTPRTPTR